MNMTVTYYFSIPNDGEILLSYFPKCEPTGFVFTLLVVLTTKQEPVFTNFLTNIVGGIHMQDQITKKKMKKLYM